MLRIKSMKLLNGKTVSINLNQGEAIVLKGQNGSGKSLLLKSIAKLLPSTFETYEYQSKSVSTYKAEVLRSDIVYVSTSSSMSEGSVEDFFNNAFSLQIYKDFTPTFPWKDYINNWKVGTGRFQDLSSGQKQMLSILRALSLRGKVLLLDEPTANLDYDKTLEVEELIKNWMSNTGGSVILVSHSEEQIRRLGFKTVSFDSLISSGT